MWEIKEWLASKTGGHCPFVGNPLAECYIADLHSQNIEEAIYYCDENYKACEIYKREISVRGGGS